jgi:two-component system LytT family response regulator
MLRTIIIDDEDRSRKSLETLLEKYCSGVNVIDTADGVETGKNSIRENDPDLVMLDIRMQDGTGFDLLKSLQKTRFHLIFTTAYDEYAIKAFKFNAIDYLLKPIDVEELEAAIIRVQEKMQKPTEQQTADIQIRNLLNFNRKAPKITVSTEHTFEFLSVPDIIRLEADGAYTHFILKGDRKVISSKNLKYYDEMMEEYNFLRIHNSHTVNLRFVLRYLKREGGYVELENGDKIPVSRRRKEVFLQNYTAH